VTPQPLTSAPTTSETSNRISQGREDVLKLYMKGLKGQ
jgi:hypothetical protein